MAGRNMITNADGKSYDIDNGKDDIFGRNGTEKPPPSVRSSALSSSSYFSNLLPPASAATDGVRNNSPQSDLYRILNKHRGDDQLGHGQSAGSGTKDQGSPSKGHTPHKDVETACNELRESVFLGVHYGGRDFYASSSPQASEAKKSYKSDEADEYEDSNVINRGEWWQGSFYY